MPQDYDILIEKIEGYYEQQKPQRVKEMVREMYPGDLAYIAAHLDVEYLDPFLDEIKERPELDEILFMMDPEEVIPLLRKIPPARVNALFKVMDTDDAAKILGYLPEDLLEWVQANIAHEDFAEASALLEYEEDSAGRIMSLDFLVFSEEDSVREILAKIRREHHIAETIYSLYVVDKRNHLVGVCSLRELVTQPEERLMKDFMRENVISVDATMDREEVAKIVERYNLNAVPVVDDQNKLIGLITVDDVIKVIRSEATEDFMKLAGTSGEELSFQSPFKGFLRRMPWLLVSFVGGLMTIQTNFFFAKLIHRVEFLAFVTVIAGMGGNIASQSSTIVVRGLATGKILVSELWEVLAREVSVGLMLGVFFGAMLGLAAQIQFTDVTLIGLCVLVGMLFSMLIAATVGSLMPIVFQRFDIDPAVATGPFVSTTIDNLGLLGYFGSILLILNIFI